MRFQSTPSTRRETGQRAGLCIVRIFQSTPSTRRETRFLQRNLQVDFYFNPLPPHGGRPPKGSQNTIQSLHFNPLPPHGGRLYILSPPMRGNRFQSTPSTRRETLCSCTYSFIVKNFNPLPPHGGRHRRKLENLLH